jgi:Tfp pilus assembly protein PilV
MKDRLRTAHRHAERGITLVEVLVALLLFAVGTLALASLIPTGTKSVSSSGEHTRASELAAWKIEQLLDTPYNHPDLDAGVHNDVGNPFPGSYHVSWNVELNQPFTACKRLTVTVRWPLSGSSNLVRIVGVRPQSSL